MLYRVTQTFEVAWTVEADDPREAAVKALGRKNGGTPSNGSRLYDVTVQAFDGHRTLDTYGPRIEFNSKYLDPR